MSITPEKQIAIEDQRIRHADTQAAGLMTLTGTGVAILGAGNGFELGRTAEKGIAISLILTFVFAIASRLVDVVPPLGTSDQNDPCTRELIGGWKGVLIALALVSLLVAVLFAGYDVLH